jgi:hypothetical protein
MVKIHLFLALFPQAAGQELPDRRLQTDLQVDPAVAVAAMALAAQATPLLHRQAKAIMEPQVLTAVAVAALEMRPQIKTAALAQHQALQAPLLPMLAAAELAKYLLEQVDLAVEVMALLQVWHRAAKQIPAVAAAAQQLGLVPAVAATAAPASSLCAMPSHNLFTTH